MIGNSGIFGNDWDKFNAHKEALRFETFVVEGGRGFFMDVYIIEEVFDYYLNKHQKSKAKKLLEFAVEQHPYVTELFFKKSCLEFDLENYHSSLRDINQALSLRSSEYRFLIQKARILTKMEEHNLAIDQLYEALDCTQNSAEIYYHIGQVHFLNLNFKHAIRFYVQSLTIEPQNESIIYEIIACYKMMGDIKGGLHFCEEYINNNPYNHHAWYNQGLLQFEIGLFEFCIISFDYSTIIKKDFVLGYQGRARGFAALFKLESAISCLLESLIFNNTNFTTLLLLGECYEQCGKYDLARKYYQECTIKNPEIPQGWFCVGSTLEEQNQYLLASIQYKRAIELDNEYYDAWLGLADCEYWMGNLVSAYEALQKAVCISPDDVSLWINWSERLDNDGNTDGAVLLLEEGLRLNPASLELIYRYSAFLFKIGRTNEAFAYLENGLLIDFDKHTLLYQICPQIMVLLPIQEVIEQYRPRFLT